jgi:hypothetical protein
VRDFPKSVTEIRPIILLLLPSNSLLDPTQRPITAAFSNPSNAEIMLRRCDRVKKCEHACSVARNM